jgi:hypothetical protein
MDSFTTKGVWWPAGQNDTAVGGVLTFSKDTGAELELLGVFVGESDPLFEGSSKIVLTPVIHGNTTDGKAITLLRCWQTHWQVTGRLSTSRYRAAFVVIGTHCVAFEELRVSRLLLSFDQLPQWFGSTAIRQSISDSKGAGRGEDMTVAFSADLTSARSREPSVQLTFGEVRLVTNVQSQFRKDQASLTQKISFYVVFSDSLPFEYALNEVVYHFHNLVTLGVGAPVGIIEFSIALWDENDNDSSRQARTTRSYYQVLHESTRVSGIPPRDRNVQSHQMPFRYSDVAAVWPEILTRLFQTAEALRPVYDLYFATVYGPRLYLQNRFLNFAQAAETLHRRAFGSSRPLTADSFEIIETRLRNLLWDPSLPLRRALRDEFIRRVSYWNELSLRRRIRELLVPADRSLHAGLRELTGKPKAFADAVVGTRNYLTHYDPEDAVFTQSMTGLLRQTERLGCILRVHLMCLLGVPSPVIVRHLERTAKQIAEMRFIWEVDYGT